MNTFTGFGRLIRKAKSIDDEKNTLTFKVACRQHDYDQHKDKQYIDCLIYNPNKALEQALTEEYQGLFVRFKGYLASTQYKSNSGVFYKNKVIIDPRRISISKSFQY